LRSSIPRVAAVVGNSCSRALRKNPTMFVLVSPSAVRHFLSSSLVSVALLLNAGQALAECPSGTYPCGADYCTPTGAVCCASVGDPSTYCPSGTVCQADGKCQQPGGSGGGCKAGTYACSDGSGCCESGTICGNGSNGCGADKCCQPGGSDPGGGTCPGGSYACAGGNDCCATGTICGTGSNGCGADRCCEPGGGTQPGGSTQPGGTTPGSTPGAQCTSGAVGACTRLDSCCAPASGSSSGLVCWYVANGKRFDCGASCDSGDAQRAVDYCNATNGGSSSGSPFAPADEEPSCAVGTPGAGGTGALAVCLGTAVALLGASRRRRRAVGIVGIAGVVIVAGGFAACADPGEGDRDAAIGASVARAEAQLVRHEGALRDVARQTPALEAGQSRKAPSGATEMMPAVRAPGR
jgi:hypothetical protein